MDDTVHFSWQEGEPIIKKYQFELASDEMFSSVQVDSVLSNTSVALDELSVQSTYWWRVRAQNEIGWGIFSDPESFTFILTNTSPSGDIPQEYTLSQNYPNPFNPSTIIEFALPEPGDVELVVYNILGREVASLVNSQKQAGYHQVIFDAGHLASGIYIYRLQANEFQLTRQLTLIK